MRSPDYQVPGPVQRPGRWIFLVVLLALLVLSARTIAGYIIEYQWWREMAQVPTWLDMLTYSVLPRVAAAILAFVVLFVAHARALKFAGTGLGRHKLYARLSTLALLGVSAVVSMASIEPWTVVRFFGARGLSAEATRWQDPVFGNPLRFYLFDLPFWSQVLGFVLALSIVAALIYWLAARAWQLRDQFSELQSGAIEIDPRTLLLGGALESVFLRVIGALVLLGLAVHFFLARYAFLFNDHRFMVGINYVDETYRLPLQWLVIICCIASTVPVLLGRWRWVLIIPAAMVLRAVVPGAVAAIYVRPNEISIERPYIQRHIQATRAAYGLDKQVKEIEYPAKLEAKFDLSAHSAVFNNVRLWDWRAFHDTVTQIQALRPYYTFSDTDVDRYMIDGRLRQIMLSPRELDINQLPDAARGRWINPHFIYTHGYGMVMAEANRITENGLPVLQVQDAPARVNTPSLKLTRPQIYYGETVHEPVFVHTAEKEFDFPSGSGNEFYNYTGKGGFPITSFGLRLAAAVARADFNIVLTSYLTGQSRMMIRRDVRDRVSSLAGFLQWDRDPYLVLTNDGRLVWTLDGYTTSDAHPYSRLVSVPGVGTVNYMRNSVKATVDAYDGTVTLYIFDETDPIVSAYRTLFPNLFRPASEMPADLRQHTRYPETLFRVQAEIYRTYHMLDPQAFYNSEDLWDVGRTMRGQNAQPEPMTPTYMVAALPGENEPEFLLVLPFTPRNKENLIGLMVARCDGPHLGELVVFELSKQALIYGPMQIEARINQDQNISKDLSLWNQQGSQVLRGQMLVLPIENTLVYVQPIYIQATEARMPQLKKVALAMGDRLIYEDTYDRALAELARYMGSATAVQEPPPGTPATPQPSQTTTAPAASPQLQQRLDTIRDHMRRYREFSSQGKWSEAGKELEALEREAGRR